MPLTDADVRTAKPREKPYKLHDGHGMFVLINPNNSKWWRIKYRFQGREKSLSLGTYPDVSLKKARQQCTEARSSLAQGTDPSTVRTSSKRQSSQTLESLAREWFAIKSPGWAESHSKKILRRLEMWIFPSLGTRQIKSVSAFDVLETLRRLERLGKLETAHRVLGYCSQIFRYAIITQRAERDVAGDLRGALQTPTKTHYSAITNPSELGGLLRAIEGYRGTFVVACALQLTPLLLVRPGELRHMEWDEVDLPKNVWTIPGEKMGKTKRSHIVPLAEQAATILTDLRLHTGPTGYAFPSANGGARPMSENTTNGALRRLGFAQSEVTSHGFRATARTLMDEELNERPELIEHQLSHMVKDPLGRAYNRTKHLRERHHMMQRWANYLDELKNARLQSL